MGVPMTRLPAVLLAAAALLGVAGTASADACDQLNGGRWVAYIEGGRPERIIGASMWDFRTGLVGGKVFGNRGTLPFPAASPSVVHGDSTVQLATACSATGNVATISFNSGASVLATVSQDGMSATLAGGQNLAGYRGWAARAPY